MKAYVAETSRYLFICCALCLDAFHSSNLRSYVAMSLYNIRVKDEAVQDPPVRDAAKLITNSYVYILLCGYT